MPKKIFTVADYLLTRLKQLNVTEVFQIPGDYVKHFTQALEYFPGVNAIGAINELDAAYAADAYGRTRGLGAVSLQYGVSTFSALNAIAGAYVEFSPVVVISATPGADARQITKMYDVLYHHSTGNLQADQEVFRQVTVAAETLSTSVGAGEKIDNLLVAAITYKRPSEFVVARCDSPEVLDRRSRSASGPRSGEPPIIPTAMGSSAVSSAGRRRGTPRTLSQTSARAWVLRTPRRRRGRRATTARRRR